MGKKSRRIRTKPGAAGSNAQSEETELVTICLQIRKLSEKQKWEEILNLESEFRLELAELFDKHKHNFELCTVIAACIGFARAYHCHARHSKRNFDSAMGFYRIGWTFADPHLTELSLADSEKCLFHIVCGEGMMYCLKELARPAGWDNLWIF